MTDDAGDGELDRQMHALTEIVGALTTMVSQLRTRVDNLTGPGGHGSGGQGGSGDDQDNQGPAAWVWFSPPAAAEDDPDIDDPRFTVDNFVAWYNLTYVGAEGSRAKPIPDCWRQHPGLAMEVATLAYSWRTANIGPAASPREAQYWHHQSRPGFADRMAREWTHPDCADGDHRATGAGGRPDRYTLTDGARDPWPTAPAPSST